METTKNNTSAPLLSGVDIVSIILKKWKLIVCLSLILAVVASAGVFVLVKVGTTYGNSVDFYLSRKDSRKVLLPILQSESFAEKLLLDEYGLPEELAGTNNEQYEEAKAAVIAFREARESLKATRKEYGRINLALTTPKDPVTGETITSFELIEHEYGRLCNIYDAIYSMLSTYKGVDTDSIVTEGHIQKIAELEERLEIARTERDLYKKHAYDPARLETLACYENYMLETRKTNDLKDEADKLVEEVLIEWRNNEEVQKQIRKITKAMTFGYIIPEQTEDELPDDVESGSANQIINFSFLKVSVAVEGDQEFADFIISRLKRTLPSFVELTIDDLASTLDTECNLISTFSSARELNPESTLITLVLTFGLTFVAVAVIVAIAVACAEWLRRSGVIKQKEEKQKPAA
ncbi:MAG: hypothetical protein IJC64_01800 [Clostridia bacterium]|nr:hypothetical protein [Clostridia bacterium]